DFRRELPYLQNHITDGSAQFVNDSVQSQAIDQKGRVFLGVSENREHTNLVYQACQGSLIRAQVGVVLAQYMTDTRNFGGTTPDFTQPAVHQVGGGLKHL